MSTFYGSKRTDIASETVKTRVKRIGERIERTDVTVDERAAKRLKKAPGRYTAVSCRAVADGDRTLYGRLISALADALDEYVRGENDCLVVGLGNPAMTADALGSEVVKRIDVTNEDGSPSGIRTLCPNVSGVTGVESFDVVKGVCDRVSPRLVIVVDSLCAASGERLSAVFQISDAGITPGSGVSNYRFRIDENSIGARVVTIGVPLVVYATTLVREAAGDESDCDGELIVTPKDVDAIVVECAYIIASAINRALKG